MRLYLIKKSSFVSIFESRRQTSFLWGQFLNANLKIPSRSKTFNKRVRHVLKDYICKGLSGGGGLLAVASPYPSIQDVPLREVKCYAEAKTKMKIIRGNGNYTEEKNLYFSTFPPPPAKKLNTLLVMGSSSESRKTCQEI